MAIYFDDKVLHPKADGSELERMYHQGMTEIDALYKKHGGTVTLRRNVKRTMDTTGTSYKPIPPTALPTVAHLVLDELGSVSVRYSKDSPIRQEKGYMYPMQRLWVTEALILDNKQKDLAWFLIKAAGFVRAENEESKGAKFLFIEDLAKQAEGRVEDLRRFVKLDSILLDEQSPIYNRTDIQAIADKLGVEINEKNLLSAVLVLRDAIVAGDKKNNPTLNVNNALNVIAKVAKTKEKKPAPDLTDVASLDSMDQKDLNEISKSLNTPFPPRCNRADQIQHILKKQNVLA